MSSPRTAVMLLAVAALVAPVACGDDDDSARAPARTAPAAPTPESDASAVDDDQVVAEPIDRAPGDPHAPVALDEYQPTGQYRQPTAPPRTLEITLRSTPPGATAAVDGKIVGPTPTFWRGKMTGKPHEFTFVLPRYAMARYRFVPTANGVVHATLHPLAADEPDAGAPE